MPNFKKLSAYVDVPCEWVSVAAPRNNKIDQLKAENDKLRELVTDMYKRMDASCQFGHAIPVGTMAHIKNRAIGLGLEVDG